MSTATIDRDWIAQEFSKGIDAEGHQAHDLGDRAGTPPDESLSVLYHEIAEADARHVKVIEAVAIRYGHTPKGTGGTVGKALGSIKDTVQNLVHSSSVLERVSHDLAVKANAIHWYTAWIQAFEAIGDADSVRELSAVLAEETSHRDALQQGLNQLVAKGAQGTFGH